MRVAALWVATVLLMTVLAIWALQVAEEREDRKWRDGE